MKKNSKKSLFTLMMVCILLFATMLGSLYRIPAAAAFVADITPGDPIPETTEAPTEEPTEEPTQPQPQPVKPEPQPQEDPTVPTEPEKPEPVHQHTEKVTQVAATCTKIGYTRVVCETCNTELSYTEIASLGHEMGDWYTVVVATTETEGKEQRDCIRHDHSEYRSIDKLEEEHRCTWMAQDLPATCTTDGYHREVCIECGEVRAEVTIPAGHEEVIDSYVAPTCGETGLTEGSHCARCHKVFKAQDVIAAHGNHPGYYEVSRVLPQPGADGYILYHCTHCSHTYTAVLKGEEGCDDFIF